MSSSADLVLVLPYTGEEGEFRLSDRVTGKHLAAANLSGAAAAFSKTYPADPARPAGNAGQFRLPQDAQALVAGVGIVLFLLLAWVFLLMISGKKKA